MTQLLEGGVFRRVVPFAKPLHALELDDDQALWLPVALEHLDLAPARSPSRRRRGVTRRESRDGRPRGRWRVSPRGRRVRDPSLLGSVLYGGAPVRTGSQNGSGTLPRRLKFSFCRSDNFFDGRQGQTRREVGTQSKGPHARQPGYRNRRRAV